MRRRLLILIWHRVLPGPDPLRPQDPDVKEFTACAALLKRWFNVLPLKTAVDGLRKGSLPSRAACITFDDGYADNLTNALPILQSFDLPATIFVATGFLDGGRMWNDSIIELVARIRTRELDARAIDCGILSLRSDTERLNAVYALIDGLKYREPEERQRAVDTLAEQCGLELPTDLMLSRSGVKQLAEAGVEIGGHTQSHPILANLSDSAARQEIERNREDLTSLLGFGPRFFAYPNGRPDTDYGKRDVGIIEESGYEAAVSTRPGVAARTDDRFQLPRFGPWKEPRVKLGLRLIKMSYMGS